MIDNYEQAIALLDKMKVSLPILIKITPEAKQKLGKQASNLSKDHIFTVDSVFYTGDEGGILCSIQIDQEGKEVHLVSLTHLRIQDNHPLAEEIKDYQRKRVARLALQDGKTGKARRLAKQAKKKKGFEQL